MSRGDGGGGRDFTHPNSCPLTPPFTPLARCRLLPAIRPGFRPHQSDAVICETESQRDPRDYPRASQVPPSESSSTLPTVPPPHRTSPLPVRISKARGSTRVKMLGRALCVHRTDGTGSLSKLKERSKCRSPPSKLPSTKFYQLYSFTALPIHPLTYPLTTNPLSHSSTRPPARPPTRPSTGMSTSV